MCCGPNRVFDAKFKACILIGTTRSARQGVCDQPKAITQSEQCSFNCTNKKPGKYADDANCHIYHLCLAVKLYGPFQHMTIGCPHSTGFDPVAQKCSKKGRKLCKKISDSTQKPNVYCEKEFRFREARSCDRYFVCYRKLIVEFKCPPGFLFDEKLQICKHRRKVMCE